MKWALIWTLAFACSAAILAFVWTVPVVESEPDLCVSCMGWEGQRLAITLGIPLTLIVVGVTLLVAEPERRHDDYDGCESCNWLPN